MAQINLRLELSFSRTMFRNGLAVFFLLAGVPELGSESVTLSTYYPAPSGVYTQMITTDNTWLSRNGGITAVGTTFTAAATSKLTVKGGNMTVQGEEGGGVLRLRVGNAWNYAGMYADTTSGGAGNDLVLGASSGQVRIGPDGTGQSLRVNGALSVYSDATVSGNSTTTGFVRASGAMIPSQSTSCSAVSVTRGAPGPAAACGGYITTVAGLFSRYYSVEKIEVGGSVSAVDNTVAALCCPCPAPSCAAYYP
jgi:hypothetical protein